MLRVLTLLHKVLCLCAKLGKKLFLPPPAPLKTCPRGDLQQLNSLKTFKKSRKTLESHLLHLRFNYFFFPLIMSMSSPTPPSIIIISSSAWSTQGFPHR